MDWLPILLAGVVLGWALDRLIFARKRIASAVASAVADATATATAHAGHVVMMNYGNPVGALRDLGYGVAAGDCATDDGWRDDYLDYDGDYSAARVAAGNSDPVRIGGPRIADLAFGGGVDAHGPRVVAWPEPRKLTEGD